MKRLLSRLLQLVRIRLSLWKDIFYFHKLTIKYNASIHTDNDIEKMQYTLLRENHTIEKGLSLKNPRKGFGQQKVLKLLKRLNKYFDVYGKTDKEFLIYPLGTIKHYIHYTKSTGVEIPIIEREYKILMEKSGFVDVKEQGGIIQVSKDEILKKCNSSFESLLNSRHSIRYFSKETVTKDIIEKALNLAQRTPSACNRQGWHTHVFQGEESVRLIKWQGGSHGFEDEIRTSILVTANLKAFLYYEIHQAYIDGGLYAMNLINALHSLGLGTIPLSCGFTHDKLKGLADFDIPKNEVPIVIIGVGNLLENFNVAISKRKNINLTNKFH
ncbi:nitroreductase family protein [Bacteroides gallinaceum]|uniref:nitroreductase family protein n=1 Tax=Bacteroides gallinaceum TaxID=1462571 RepID=UPI00195AAE44|nr:nitroreductase family protein [Bacteroides gallinaceum]MBM6657425.1 nitroreductase family protein [Bacteroides gallinaceum]